MLSFLDLSIGCVTKNKSDDEISYIDPYFSYSLSRVAKLGYAISMCSNQNYTEEGKSYSLDIGVYKKFIFMRDTGISHKVTIGTSLFNLTYSKINYSERLQSKDVLPVRFCIGSAYGLSYNCKLFLPKLKLFQFTVTLEYLDLFNSRYYSSLKGGAEISLFNVLSGRIGWYKFDNYDRGDPINKDFLKENTYGFGISLPVNIITNGKIPITVSFD